jgi:hypothetical protein
LQLGTSPLLSRSQQGLGTFLQAAAAAHSGHQQQQHQQQFQAYAAALLAAPQAGRQSRHTSSLLLLCRSLRCSTGLAVQAAAAVWLHHPLAILQQQQVPVVVG